MITEPCGADIPVREPKAQLCLAAQTRACPELVEGTSGSTRFVRRAFSVLRSVLLEMFDESAYARFLQRQGITSSRAAYAAFVDEQHAMKARRARCC